MVLVVLLLFVRSGASSDHRSPCEVGPGQAHQAAYEAVQEPLAGVVGAFFLPVSLCVLFLLLPLFLALRRALSSSAPGVSFACLPGRCGFGLPVAGWLLEKQRRKEGVKPTAALEKTGAMSL